MHTTEMILVTMLTWSLKEGAVLYKEVLVNETTNISCFSNEDIQIQWHHTPPGGSVNYIYAGGRFFVSPNRGFRLEKDSNTGPYHLVIPNATYEDAGLYECKEDIGSRVFGSTQLTVVESSPVCGSNMKPQGFVGRSTCNLQQEDMTFTCTVLFSGEAPQMIWTTSNESQSFNKSTCNIENGRINCSLVLKADSKYDGTIFNCQSTKSSANCNTEIIKIQYFESDFPLVEKDIQDKVNCSVKSNQILQFKWNQLQGSQYVTLVTNQTMVIPNSGFYRCMVEYRIRNTTCSAFGSEVNVPKTGQAGTAAIVVLSIIVAICIVTIIAVICRWKKLKTMKNDEEKESEMTRLINESEVEQLKKELDAAKKGTERLEELNKILDTKETELNHTKGENQTLKDENNILKQERERNTCTKLECTGCKMRFESSIIVFGKDDREFDAFKINLNRTDEVSALQQLSIEVDNGMAAANYGGSVFVTGIGKDNNEIWSFDARYSKWNKCASLTKGRIGHSVAFVDHILCVCGGNYADDVFDDVEAYDAIDDKCSVVGKLRYAVSDAGNCVPYKASLYIFGGRNAQYEIVNRVQVYDTKLNSCTTTTSIPRNEEYLRATFFKNYSILLGKESCFLFNFDTERFEERNQFKTDVNYFSITVDNEKLFVIGGMDSKGLHRIDVRYIPISNILINKRIEWTHHAKLPKHSKVYAFGKSNLMKNVHF